MIVGALVLSNASAAERYGLHQAVVEQDIGRVKILLRKGADIDQIGSRKYGYGSALHLAVREGHTKIARLLVEQGADVDVLDPDDLTPLHNAAWNGNLEGAKLLIDAGADINASTYDGDTPLSLAQKNDQAEVAEFIQAKLQVTPAQPQPAQDPGVIDISGTYTSKITYEKGYGSIYKDPRWYWGKNPKIEVKIEQNGNVITGIISGDRTGEIEGIIEGSNITFNYHTDGLGTSAGKWGDGTWIVTDDQATLYGPWKTDRSGAAYETRGNWNMTKIESDVAQIPDISGTNNSKISGDFVNDIFPALGVWKIGFKNSQGGTVSTSLIIADKMKAEYTSFGGSNGQIFFYAVDDQGKWEGYWVQDTGGSNLCTQRKDGNRHWGVVIFQFSDDYDEFSGTWDYCGKGRKYAWNGHR